MPARASVFQVTQVGVESTLGTAVAGNRRLSTISIIPNVDADLTAFRPQGYKVATAGILAKEGVKGKITGTLCYNNIIYLLAAALTNPTVTQITPPSGTAYRWVFTPSATAPDSPKSLTVEVGSTDRAARFAGGLVTDLEISGSREGEIEVSGSILGRQLEDPFTLTASPTVIPAVPVMPTQVSIYADTSSAGLGSTKLTRVLAWSFSISDRFTPVFTVDSSQPSWTDFVERPYKAQLKLTLEAESQAMGLLSAMRNGDKRFIRLEALGALIETGNYYRFAVDMAGVISDWGDFSDEDGVFAVELTFDAVFDATWGKALEITVQNTRSTL